MAMCYDVHVTTIHFDLLCVWLSGNASLCILSIAYTQSTAYTQYLKCMYGEQNVMFSLKCTRKNKTALTGMTILRRIYIYSSLLCFFIKWLTSWCAGIQTWVAPCSAYCSCGRPWPQVVLGPGTSAVYWSLLPPPGPGTSAVYWSLLPLPRVLGLQRSLLSQQGPTPQPLLNKHKPVLTLGDQVFLHLNATWTQAFWPFESRSESVTLEYRPWFWYTCRGTGDTGLYNASFARLVWCRMTDKQYNIVVMIHVYGAICDHAAPMQLTAERLQHSHWADAPLASLLNTVHNTVRLSSISAGFRSLSKECEGSQPLSECLSGGIEA